MKTLPLKSGHLDSQWQNLPFTECLKAFLFSSLARKQAKIYLLQQQHFAFSAHCFSWGVAVVPFGIIPLNNSTFILFFRLSFNSWPSILSLLFSTLISIATRDKRRRINYIENIMLKRKSNLIFELTHIALECESHRKKGQSQEEKTHFE